VNSPANYAPLEIKATNPFDLDKVIGLTLLSFRKQKLRKNVSLRITEKTNKK
jgi:hypothetical protein